MFGTTYTPLELFIVNAGIKGPGWMSVPKQFLSNNEVNSEGTLCASIQNAELINCVRENIAVPNLRVMAISVRAVVPARVKVKRLFDTNRVDDLHIYSISYFFCDSYQV